MPVDTVTVLRSLTLPLAKTIIRTPDGMASVEVGNFPAFYSAEDRSVDGIRAFAALADETSSDPQKCFVRGKIAPTANRARMRRQKLAKGRKNGQRSEPTLIETPR